MVAPTTADTIVNEALVELGVDPFGDMWQGSRASEAARQVYDTVLRGMHQVAQWNFARRQRPLEIRADLSGAQVNNRVVPIPWSYAYEWPIDCVRFHEVFSPDAGHCGMHGRSLPFVVADMPWPNDVDSDWPLTEGHTPESTRAILTNQVDAVGRYTGIVQHPDAWPAMFRRALVATLASRIAMSAIPDKALARAMRGEMTAIARDALVEARVADGNEGWTVKEWVPDWIAARGWYGPLGT